MSTAFIMACLPVDTSTLPAIDQELPKPTNLYSLIQCESCKQDMWIGPRQLVTAGDLMLAGVDVFKFCYLCSIKAQAYMGQTTLTNLGGGQGVEGVVRA